MPSLPHIASAAAQAPGSIRGRLVLQDTGEPVSGAAVVILGTDRIDTTDPQGLFRHERVPAGKYLLQARADGYHVTTWEVAMAPDQLLLHVFEIQSTGVALGGDDVVVLPGVAVTGDATPKTWMVDFERRRLDRGRGMFLTREDIEQRHATNTLTDLLREVNGVRISCRGGECGIRMARTNCRPMYYLDGFPAQAATAERTLAYDIAGIEVYRSASETPAELQRSDLRCGVIAIWTRRGPPPK